MSDPTAGERAAGLVEMFLDERLRLSRGMPGVRGAVVDGVLERLDAINDRFDEQFKHLGTQGSKRIPDAYYADEQEVENELQKVGAGIRTALALAGTTLGDPIEIERHVAFDLAPTGRWALRSEASRVPRPPTRPSVLDWSLPPTPWAGDPDAEWPPPGADTLSGVRQLTEPGGGEPARVNEEPYTDWAQVAFIERQRTFSSRYPDMPGRQVLLMAGLEVCDGNPPPKSGPLSELRPSLWAHPYTDLVNGFDQDTARAVLAEARKPLAALVYYARQTGAPSRERGPGLHLFCLTPQLEIAALLNLRPETPAIRHVLVDDQGPALVCRNWRSYLIHDGNYGPLEPAVHGADLIIRPDLYGTLEATIGRGRIDLGITVRHLERAPSGDD